MYKIQCTLYIIHCTVYTVYTVHCTLYTVLHNPAIISALIVFRYVIHIYSYTDHDVHSTCTVVHYCTIRTLYIIHYVRQKLQCTAKVMFTYQYYVYSVHFTLYSVHYMYNVRSIRSTRYNIYIVLYMYRL